MNPVCHPPAREATHRAGRRPEAWRRSLRACLTGCLIAASVAACSAKAPKPTPAQQAEARRQQEQQEAARVAAEQDALAKRAEEQERQRKEEIQAKQLPPEFGTSAPLKDVTNVPPAPGSEEAGAAPEGTPSVAAVAPVYVPQQMPPPNTPGGVPYDKAFPPLQDRTLRVGIVSAASQAEAGQGIARMLSQEERKYMEDTLGLGIRVSYVSESAEPPPRHTRIGYRSGYLKAAVEIAALLPQPQRVDLMSEAEAARHNVDVLVRIGTDLR